MNPTFASTAAIALALALQPAQAQSPPEPAPAPAPAESKAAPPALNPAEFDKRVAQMTEHMKQMQAQMDKIARTQDPQERQRLLQEHWNSMHAAMGVMHGMWVPAGGNATGPGMMRGPMMGWGHMRGYYSGLTQEELGKRQYMMDQYLPMQQMMMDHMLWHQRWTAQQPPSAAGK